MRKRRIMILIVLVVFCITTMAPIVSAEQERTIQHEQIAEGLKTIGIFNGSNNGFELERQPTRVEAAVIIVRLLGKEKEAEEKNYEHPFSDVPQWADSYVGYLYNNNIISGVSDTKYGSDNLLNEQQCMTLLLRVLGYDDKKGDFQWDKSLEKAVEIGLIPEAFEKNFEQDTYLFIRDDVAYLLDRVLNTKIKGLENTLMEKLIYFNVITLDDALESGLYRNSENDNKDTKTSDNEPIEVVEIKKSSKVPPLTLEEHEPISEIDLSSKHNHPSSFAPLYLDTWRIQIVGYSTSSGKAVGTFEIGNLSKEPLVITKDNIAFELSSEGGADLAKSYIEGGSVTIGSNEIKTVKVISPNTNSSLIGYSIRGVEGTFVFEDGELLQEITNTKPENTVREDGVVDAPYIDTLGLVAGNGDFKVHVREIIMTDNESVGSLKRPKTRYGRIGMAKFRFANTCSETIEIKRVILLSAIAEEDNGVEDLIYLSPKDLSALGENAFPTSIIPNKIVEGYIPFIVEDGNKTSMMTIETSKGYIYISDLEIMPVTY